MRAIVELFRYVGREKELDREILAYSISHDHCAVRIYGHYPVIEGKGQKYYRHPIHKFDFTALDGKYKWTTYKFTKNVYEIWMPKHFERLGKVIDQLPADVNFELSQQSELSFTERSGLTQDLRASHLARSFASSQSSQELGDNQSSIIDAQKATPNTSVNEVDLRRNREGSADEKRQGHHRLKRDSTGHIRNDGQQIGFDEAVY